MSVARGVVAALLVAAGVPVSPVPGDARNLKITVPADLARAAGLLAAGRRSRERSQGVS